MARVLLVDDDDFLRETMTDWLIFQDHIVQTASNGLEALEEMTAGSHQVIVLDWNLPGLSGLEVVSTYRRQGGKARVIMLSGRDHRSDREASFNAGVDMYLTKPFKLPQLSQAISDITLQEENKDQ